MHSCRLASHSRWPITLVMGFAMLFASLPLFAQEMTEYTSYPVGVSREKSKDGRTELAANKAVAPSAPAVSVVPTAKGLAYHTFFIRF